MRARHGKQTCFFLWPYTDLGMPSSSESDQTTSHRQRQAHRTEGNVVQNTNDTMDYHI